MMPRRTRYGAALIAASGLLLTGCAGAESHASDSTSLSESEIAAVVAASEANLVKYTLPTGEDIRLPEGEPYDPGDKSVMVISCGQSAPACNEFSRAATEAGELAGWSMDTKDAELSADKVAGFVNQAINQRYDAIVYAGADPNNVIAAAKAAAAAGIVQVSYNSPLVDEIKDDVIEVTPDYELRGHLIGDWVIAQSKCKAPVRVFQDPSYQSTMTQLAATKERLAACGGSLEIKSTNVATSDLQHPGPPFWTAALAQNPRGTMPFAVGPYDSMAAPMVRTAVDQGRDDVAITGIDGAPENVDLIEKGDMAATATSPWEYMAYVVIDLAARKMEGLPLYDADKITGRLVTADNASDFKGWWVPQDLDYESAFARLWSAK